MWKSFKSRIFWGWKIANRWYAQQFEVKGSLWSWGKRSTWTPRPCSWHDGACLGWRSTLILLFRIPFSPHVEICRLLLWLNVGLNNATLDMIKFVMWPDSRLDKMCLRLVISILVLWTFSKLLMGGMKKLYCSMGNSQTLTSIYI